jgi:hypothetical protein
MHLLVTGAIVCGAWFNPLPAGWHQTRPVADLLFLRTGAQVSSWGANFQPSPTYGVSRGFPRNGVYIGVNLIRPPAYGNTWLILRVHLPLKLRFADIGPFEDPHLTMYRFLGRYGSQYNVDARVLFRQPTRRLLQEAQLALNGLVLPRWVPKPMRCRS